MDFLKVALGDRFPEFEKLIQDYNNNVDETGKQIRLANLSTGEYVGIGKYEALSRKTAELKNKLVEINSKKSRFEENGTGRYEANKATACEEPICKTVTEKRNKRKPHSSTNQLPAYQILTPKHLILTYAEDRQADVLGLQKDMVSLLMEACRRDIRAVVQEVIKKEIEVFLGGNEG